MRGFTLIELVLVMAVLGFLFLIVGTISFNSLPKSQLIMESDVVEQALRNAQARSIQGYQDYTWGVMFASDHLTVFAGTDYVSRSPQFDETHTFASGITCSGVSEVAFSSRTGETQDTGTILLSSDATHETRSIDVNALGQVSN